MIVQQTSKRGGAMPWAVLALAVVLVSASAGLCAAQAPEDNHAVVVNDGVEPAYADAIGVLVETAWRIYVEDLGLTLPPLITVHLTLDPEGELRLYTDGKADVYLTVTSMDELQPSPKSGVFNIYGFCHELGHIAMYSRMKGVAGLHPGVAEAWAHVCGSVVCDAVYKQKGRKLWPVPYDYKKAEGTARIRRAMKKRGRKRGQEPTDFEVAVKGFWKLHLFAKSKVFFAAANDCLAAGPSGSEFLPAFLAAVKKASRKKRLPEFFPARMMSRPFTWDPAPPDLASKATFQDLRVGKPGSNGVSLHYNPEPPDPELCRSIGGTGYFQLYRLPKQKKARVTGVEIFGCRYGQPSDDDQEVVVWICNAEMKLLHQHRFTYRELNRGKKRWLSVPNLAPTEVPRHFFVGVFFDAHATKGYFMGYQKKVSGHSYTGTPLTGLTLLRGQDWMMRVTLGQASD